MSEEVILSSEERADVSFIPVEAQERYMQLRRAGETHRIALILACRNPSNGFVKGSQFPVRGR